MVTGAGKGRRWRILIMSLAVAAGAGSPAVASDLQRMLLAPSGCFVIAPDGSVDAAAYCLDQSRAPPPEGAILASVPSSLDRTTVSGAGAPSLTLAQAVAQHVVRIEGLGEDRELRLKNLTGHAVTICIGAPTVVMGNGETEARDLERVQGEIARLLAQHPAPSDAQAHSTTQLELWDLVKKADDEENAAFARGLAPPRPQRAAKPAAGRSASQKCTAGSGGADVTLCVQ
jgi:hypothetical protein